MPVAQRIAPNPDMTRADRHRAQIGKALRRLARALLRVYFRSIDIVGLERFPKDAPIVVVGNHFNSLIDGVLLTAYLPRIPRLIASSAVWENRALRPLLALGGVIPIVRQQDAGHGAQANRATFARVQQHLADGGALALFPEGVSHSAPALQPAKTGAARIALGAEAAHGPLGVRIVPVGLIFDEKNRFRSRALIEIGPALEVPQTPEGSARETARALTDEIEEALLALTPGYESWDEASAVAHAAELWGAHTGGAGSLASATVRQRAFRDGYARLRRSDTERAARLRRMVEDDLATTRAAGLSGAHLSGDTGATSPHPHSLRTVLGLLIRLPFTVFGIALNSLPFHYTAWIGRRQPLDKRATFSLFHALYAFPATWAALAGLAAYAAARLGHPPGLAALGTLVLAVTGGFISLGFLDSVRDLRQSLRATAWLRQNPEAGAEMQEKRQGLLAELAELAAEYGPES